MQPSLGPAAETASARDDEQREGMEEGGSSYASANSEIIRETSKDSNITFTCELEKGDDWWTGSEKRRMEMKGRKRR